MRWGWKQWTSPLWLELQITPITLYNYNDVGSKLASGSFLHDGMVIIPCSSNTLAEVAHGLGDNLISRAAAVTLKEQRPAGSLAHREMPLSPYRCEQLQDPQ